jgi:hypothetical protein
MYATKLMEYVFHIKKWDYGKMRTKELHTMNPYCNIPYLGFAQL